MIPFSSFSELIRGYQADGNREALKHLERLSDQLAEHDKTTVNPALSVVLERTRSESKALIKAAIDSLR